MRKKKKKIDCEFVGSNPSWCIANYKKWKKEEEEEKNLDHESRNSHIFPQCLGNICIRHVITVYRPAATKSFGSSMAPYMAKYESCMWFKCPIWILN